MFRSRRRCLPPRAAAAIRPSTDSACCYIRRASRGGCGLDSIPRSHPNCAPPSKRRCPRTSNHRIPNPNPESRLIATTHVTPATLNRHDRLRPLSRFPTRPRHRRRHRPHWLTLGHHEMLRALHRQPRVRLVGALLREILTQVSRERTRHHRAAGDLFTAVSLLVLLRKQEKRHQERRRTSGQAVSDHLNGPTRRPSTCAAGCTTRWA